MNECKNYIHKYKCATYNENPNACENCEMSVNNPIVFILKQKSFATTYDITTTDQRSSLCALDVKQENIFQMMLDITTVLNNKGYAVLFEVD